MADVIEVQIDWSYTPKNYIDPPITDQINGGTIHFEDGKVLAKIEPAIFNQNPRMKNELQMIVERYFRSAYLEEFRDYDLTKLSRIDLREDGKTNAFIEAEPIVMSCHVSGFLTITDKNGRVVSDPKKEREERQKQFVEMQEKYISQDLALKKIIDALDRSRQNPDHDFVHLYEITEALEQKFIGERNVRDTLGISKSEYRYYRQTTNNPEIKQSRHSGKATGAQRDATSEERNKVRKIAKDLIKKYLIHLDNHHML